jgi:hypothetical protein
MNNAMPKRFLIILFLFMSASAWASVPTFIVNFTSRGVIGSAFSSTPDGYCRQVTQPASSALNQVWFGTALNFNCDLSFNPAAAPLYVSAMALCASPLLFDPATHTCETVISSASAGIESLDPVSVAAVFSVGFSWVLFCFLLSRGVGVVLNLIRKG